MVYIVIPVHNRMRVTEKCLGSLEEQTFGGFKIIVVDDGSTDGTEEMIREGFPKVILLKGDGNLWWTGATNLGVEYVLEWSQDKDYVITLNDDTIVFPDFIECLVRSAKDLPKSLIGSVSVSDQDASTVYEADMRVNWMTAKYRNRCKGKDYSAILERSSLIQPTDVLSGRGTLIPVEAFREIGLYDRRLPHHGADYEFSRRANRKGYHLFVDYRAVVVANVHFTGFGYGPKPVKWGDLIKSFFSIRSRNHLGYRFIFARLCCNWWEFPFFYAFDIFRLFILSVVTSSAASGRMVSKGDQTLG